MPRRGDDARAAHLLPAHSFVPTTRGDDARAAHLARLEERRDGRVEGRQARDRRLAVYRHVARALRHVPGGRTRQVYGVV